MFIDTAKIKLKSGSGGDGAKGFYRDKYTRTGHPDGGDGGKGGDVIIRVSTDAHTLIDFQYRQQFKAADGGKGGGKKKTGANGADCIIKVPAGTLIFDYETNAPLADLTINNQEFIIAKGGARGKGNRSHKDATPGEEGEEKIIRLELKIIADAGIVGLPNSGKSTLISKISNAHPKIASYPFTTKAPVLGVIRKDDFVFTVAEVPGLIEGASKGKGLGDLFLRHLERTRLLVHLIDVSEQAENPLADYDVIKKELKAYGKGLSKKEKIIAVNKIDLPGADSNIQLLRTKIKKGMFSISGKTGQGVDDLIEEIRKRLKKIREKENAKE